MFYQVNVIKPYKLFIQLIISKITVYTQLFIHNCLSITVFFQELEFWGISADRRGENGFALGENDVDHQKVCSSLASS